jgi:hypothetical protein
LAGVRDLESYSVNGLSSFGVGRSKMRGRAPYASLVAHQSLGNRVHLEGVVSRRVEKAS